jgi:hypothetical protein
LFHDILGLYLRAWLNPLVQPRQHCQVVTIDPLQPVYIAWYVDVKLLYTGYQRLISHVKPIFLGLVTNLAYIIGKKRNKWWTKKETKQKKSKRNNKETKKYWKRIVLKIFSFVLNTENKH